MAEAEELVDNSLEDILKKKLIEKQKIEERKEWAYRRFLEGREQDGSNTGN